MFYVYVLQSKKDHTLYIGSTNDLKRRWLEHNTGGVKSTKSKKPLNLVYYEAYYAEDDAKRRERSLKLRGQALAHLQNRISKSLLRNTS